MAWVANWIASIAKERAFAGTSVSQHGGKSVAKTYVNLRTYLYPGETTYVLLRTTYVVLRTWSCGWFAVFQPEKCFKSQNALKVKTT